MLRNLFKKLGFSKKFYMEKALVEADRPKLSKQFMKNNYIRTSFLDCKETLVNKKVNKFVNALTFLNKHYFRCESFAQSELRVLFLELLSELFPFFLQRTSEKM